jgi:hypothetical protein
MSMPESELISLLLRVGWEREDQYVHHPHLAEMAVWQDPKNGHLTFSPDLCEFIQEHQEWMIPILGFLHDGGSAPRVN